MHTHATEIRFVQDGTCSKLSMMPLSCGLAVGGWDGEWVKRTKENRYDGGTQGTG
jgi:hypothetical protein